MISYTNHSRIEDGKVTKPRENKTLQDLGSHSFRVDEADIGSLKGGLQVAKVWRDVRRNHWIYLDLAVITPEAQLSIIPEKVQLKKLLKLSKIHLFAFSLWRGELGRPGEGVDDISVNSENV